jgi:peroxidase
MSPPSWHTLTTPQARTARRRRRFWPHMERLEERCLLDAGFRSYDGTGNNLAHPDWGSTGEALLRVGPVRYADGISAPAPQGGVGRPSARVISNTIVAQTTPDRVISDRLLSAMAYGWGQFIDHDMDLTSNAVPAEPFNIPVPTGDPFFDPNGTGTQVIFFNRSEHVPGTGTSTSNPRQQPNDITAFLDASMVYGSDPVTAGALRTHSGGRLKSSPGPDGVIGTADDWLPFNNQTYFPGFHETGGDGTGAFHIANDAHIVPDSQLFMAGDVRVNENIELTSLHTLFMREHNRIADALRADNPSFSDETLYQLARRQVGAEIQVITYKEWIPAVLGSNALPAYVGYNPTVNPGIATEFSTALFRVGHSMLGDDVEFIANDGTPVRDGISLADAFFNPPQLTQQGISPILKYLGSDPSSEIDNSITDPVRNFLFGPPGAGGFDLASLNIQRGRDHGIANYNAVRVAYGLPAVTSFSQISSNPTIQAKLQQLYQNVDNIDLWVGALAEDHVAGSSTGRLIRAGLIDQFTRLRDGDRFWYQLVYSPADQAFLENNRTLADLIRLDTAADVIQDNIFFFRVSISGEVFNDLDRDGRHDAGEPGLSGRTIQLFNVNDPANPTLVATDTTDANGRYSFSVFDGLACGNYQVKELVPSGWALTSANPRNVNIPRGETFLDVDFGNRYVGTLAASSTAKGSGTSDPTATAPLAPDDSAGILLAGAATSGSVTANLPPSSDGSAGASQDAVLARDFTGSVFVPPTAPSPSTVTVRVPAAPGLPGDWSDPLAADATPFALVVV